jgi:hypothetical protein
MDYGYGGLWTYCTEGLISCHYSWTHRLAYVVLYLHNILRDSLDFDDAVSLTEIPAAKPYKLRETQSVS